MSVIRFSHHSISIAIGIRRYRLLTHGLIITDHTVNILSLVISYKDQ